MMRRILAIAVTLVALGFLPASVPAAQAAPALLWADEFNGPAGTAPNPANWAVEKIDLGNEQQTYVDDRRTAAHDGAGRMVLTAIKETSGSGRPYISGRLSNGFSAQPHFFTYGRLDARMLIPQGQGVWPAFWTLGDWSAIQHWPRVEEVDVMEAINAGDVTHGGIHTVAASDNTSRVSLGGHGPVHPSGSWANGWHVWSIVWTPGRIVWRIDGVAWQTITRAQVQAAGGVWGLDGLRPQAPILNLAVGGDWAGPASGWALKRFKIDYVRLYSA